MNNYIYKPIYYKSEYFNNLRDSYEESFNKKFISQEVYERRFIYGLRFSSYILISKDSEVVGHIGLRIHNLNSKENYKIAFRFSTFLIPALRGSGIYQRFMDYVKNDLKVNFGIDFIYAWPNRINLNSCLKDVDYINLNPIITWEHKLGNDEYKYSREEFFEYKKLDFIQFESTISENQFSLTKELENNFHLLFKDRTDKKYKIISSNNSNFAILGISFINNKQLISIVFNKGLKIEYIINVLNMQYGNFQSIVQSWCFYRNKKLLRELLKCNFSDNGPVFYNGVYELGDIKFPLNDYFPSMYNHDAF